MVLDQVREKSYASVRNLFHNVNLETSAGLLKEFPEVLDILIDSLREGEKTATMIYALNTFNAIFEKEVNFTSGMQFEGKSCPKEIFIEKGGLKKLERLGTHHEEVLASYIDQFLNKNFNVEPF